MTQQITRTPVPAVLSAVRDQMQPILETVVDRLADPQMRLVARYQMGWCDAEGRPTNSGGKAIRPALAMLSAEAVLGTPHSGIPGAVAVELVHNFSLLHDDVMDRDVERRHRPTGWVAFGEGQAILAGNAMFALAVETLLESGVAGQRSLSGLLEATQLLISGQSQDLLLEGRGGVELDDVLAMEAGKTAALLSYASSVGALGAGAPDHIVAGLARFGHELGVAFQLVDDILGVVGDPEKTGKSSSSDVRAGKRSAPIVAALTARTPAAHRLAALFAGGPPTTEADVALAAQLVADAGGLDWAGREADCRLKAALDHLHGLKLAHPAVEQLADIATYVVSRDQ
jgi:geranylgeranyl diphosphate synthase type I